MTSQGGKQTIAIHILPDISRIKGNQKRKIRQLIVNNMKNMFLEKLYTECGGATSPCPFSKKTKLNISLNQQSEVSYNLFCCMPKSMTTKIYCNQGAIYLSLFHIKLF